ncbi:hypothetical protein Unana1_05775 [Umbelopsis nana]
MTEITVTPTIKEALNKAIRLPSCNDQLQQEMETACNADMVSMDILRRASRLLVESCGDDAGQYWIHELLKGSSIYRPPVNPELQARLDKIAADNQNKEYARMVKSVVGSEQDKLAFKIPHDEMQEIRGHVTAIMNVLFSIIACFGAFFKMSSVLTSDTGSRTLLSLFGALFVGIAEVALYMRYLTVAQTPPKQKKQRVKKKVN